MALVGRSIAAALRARALVAPPLPQLLWAQAASYHVSCAAATAAAKDGGGKKASDSEAEAEFVALGSMTQEIADKVGAQEAHASTDDAAAGVDSLVHAARKKAKEAYASMERTEVQKSISKAQKQYAAGVSKLAHADATSSMGIKTHTLAANPYGWDVDAREVKQAPLWMLYEESRGESKIVDRTAGRKPPQIDNDTEIRVAMRDEKGRAYATGRRKTAVARVWVAEGDGAFTVNGKSLPEYFPRLHDRLLAMEPLVVTEACGAFNVTLTVASGGLTGQAGAIRHGLANALARFDPQLKPVLRRFKLIQRDPRMVERKKPGQKKARKKFQWIKR